MRNVFVLAALAAFMLSSVASADVVVSEDFESYTVGQNATGWTVSDPWTGGQRFLYTVADTAGPAGLFGSDKYGNLESQATGFSFVNNDAIADFGTGTNPIATLSFDMIVPTATNADGLGCIRISTHTDDGGRFADVALSTYTGGEVIEYTAAADIVVHYDYVVDATSGAALYVNGVVEDPLVGAALAGTDINRFSLWANAQAGTDGATTYYVDNVVVRNEAFITAAIPEPSSILLTALGLVVCGVSRRRR